LKSVWGRRLGPLVLIAFALFGAFLWKGGFDLLPAERSISWKIPGDFASIRKVELQLYRGDTLLKREELSTPTGLTLEPTQKIVLERGKYRAQLLVWRDGATSPASASAVFEVADDDVLVVAPL
jgi:hypothetical protein